MLKQQILEDLKKAVKDLGFPATDIVVSIPQNPAFGTYTTNLALQLAKLKGAKGKQSPVEIANKILTHLGGLSYLSKVEIAGGGFINFFIKDEVLLKNLANATMIEKVSKTVKILVEYGHANILKEAHIGHLRTYILGESLSRTLEFLGYQVFRANYQGDVGLHVAKALWGIIQLGLPERELSLEEKAKFLGQAYALGSNDYDENPEAKKKIDGINVAIYQKDPNVMDLYKTGRDWSLEYYEDLYKLLGIKYDRLFFESEVYELGKKLVLENTGTIFEKSDGAIIFPGEKFDLHNRVFITSAGNTTYEAKEMGLAEVQYEAFNYDRAIYVVGSEQAGYFQVVIKALELLFSHLLGKKHHLSYGMVDLKAGKMSSRTGNIVSIDSLVKIVSEKVEEIVKGSKLDTDKTIIKQIALGAIKFAYLKFSPTSNMIFNLEQSVSLEGDSGPYLQYTYARIQSVLKMAGSGNKDFQISELNLEAEEKTLLRRLEYFAGTVEQAGIGYRPNLLCEYLLDLARDFNLFYQKHRIINSGKKEFRLQLAQVVGEVLKIGLNLLGIETPERM
ncbi:MAG: arginine--tRNA ligase [Candidatus Daviesbacteria bacterium]|nr:arginine--tRNA ligase [Candidatus Daviesbacteria bacterium]